MKHFADPHERAFALICARASGQMGEKEQAWLDDHLLACAQCSAAQEQTASAIAALKTVSIRADSDLVQSTQRRVRARSMRSEMRRRRMRPIWISSAFASIWMACATPYLWQSFDWTGHWLHIPDLLWQMGFLVAWFTPGLTAAAVALWLRPQLTASPRSRMTRATA